MKIITVSGTEPIPIEYRIRYLQKKGVKFHLYVSDYSDDEHRYLKTDIKDVSISELSNWEAILSEKDLGEDASYTTANMNNIEFDMRDLRRDTDFIEIVESSTCYDGGLRVVEIKQGDSFRISYRYDGYVDESYEIIEIFNESDWELAE